MPIYKKTKDNKVIGYYYSTYYKDVFNNTKRKVSKTFATKKECERAEIEFKQSVLNNDTISNITYSNFLDNIYFVEKQRVLKKRSYTKVSTMLKYNTSKISKVELNDISPLMMAKVYDDLLNGNHNVNGANQIFAYISSTFNFAVKRGYIKVNPCHLVEKKKVDKVTIDDNGNVLDNRLNIWTIEEFNLFISYFKGKSERHAHKYYAMFSLMFYTGIRIGECCALKVNDIDLEKGTMRINKSYDHLHSIVTTPKTSSSVRVVYLCGTIIDILKEHIEYIKRFKAYSDDCYLFGIRVPCTYSTISGQWFKAIDSTGVKRIRIHDLRHSYASRLIGNGYSVIFVSKQLGHSDITTTLNTYTSLLKDVESKEVERLRME